MNKKVLVKFCGHCNPRLSMKEVLKELNALNTDYEYLFYNEKEDGDLCLVLCGCPAMCASHLYQGAELRVHPNINETPDNMALRILLLLQKLI